MCGRYSLGEHPDVQQQVGVDYPAVNPARWIGAENHRPRFNVAPRSNAAVLRREAEGAQEVVMQTMKWGVIPHWTKHQPEGPLNTINARSEALLETAGGMWASLKGKKRCLVVCDGYYEWLKKGAQKVPHFTKRADGKCMLLAGLWDSVTFEGATEPLYTYTIITTDSNKELSFLHDRMPVVLSEESELLAWLDPSTEWSNVTLGKLLRPYEHHLECYPVAQEVGNVRNDSPTFIQPISNRSDGIQAMFKKQEAKSSPSKPAKASSSQSKDYLPTDSSNPSSRTPKKEDEESKQERPSSPEIVSWVSEDNQPSDMTAEKKVDTSSTKRQLEDEDDLKVQQPSVKKAKTSTPKARATQKATPTKGKGKTAADSGCSKITSFFSKG